MKHLLVFGIVFSALHFSLSEIPDFCSMEPEMGDGSKTEMHLYYNAVQDQCVPFKYSGEGGNPNRFSNERECMRTCSANVENVYPIDEKNACLLVKSPGVCKGHFLRFYYDAVHEKCKKFHFSGCGGNGNRFPEFDACTTTCAGVKRDGRSGPGGEGQEPEEDEPDTNVGAIVASVLSVILVAVVATLIALAVKSKKKKSKKTKDKRDKTATPLTDQAIEMS